MRQALKEACAALDADMRDLSICGFDASHSGTTACVALFAGKQLLVANTGMSTFAGSEWVRVKIRVHSP